MLYCRKYAAQVPIQEAFTKFALRIIVSLFLWHLLSLKYVVLYLRFLYYIFLIQYSIFGTRNLVRWKLANNITNMQKR